MLNGTAPRMTSWPSRRGQLPCGGLRRGLNTAKISPFWSGVSHTPCSPRQPTTRKYNSSRNPIASPPV